MSKKNLKNGGKYDTEVNETTGKEQRYANVEITPEHRSGNIQVTPECLMMTSLADTSHDKTSQGAL